MLSHLQGGDFLRCLNILFKDDISHNLQVVDLDYIKYSV